MKKYALFFILITANYIQSSQSYIAQYTKPFAVAAAAFIPAAAISYYKVNNPINTYVMPAIESAKGIFNSSISYVSSYIPDFMKSKPEEKKIEKKPKPIINKVEEKIDSFKNIETAEKASDILYKALPVFYAFSGEKTVSGILLRFAAGITLVNQAKKYGTIAGASKATQERFKTIKNGIFSYFEFVKSKAAA